MNPQQPENFKWMWDYPGGRDEGQLIFTWEWNAQNWCKINNSDVWQGSTASFEIVIRYERKLPNGQVVKIDGVSTTLGVSDDERRTFKHEWVYIWTPPANTNLGKLEVMIHPVALNYNSEGGSRPHWYVGQWFAWPNVGMTRPVRPDNIVVERDPVPGNENNIMASMTGIVSSEDSKYSNVKFVEFQLVRFDTKENYDVVYDKYDPAKSEDENNKLIYESNGVVEATTRYRISATGNVRAYYEMTAGYFYTVRARFIAIDGDYESTGEWSNLSDKLVRAIPKATTITKVYYNNKTKIHVEWEPQVNVQYMLEWTSSSVEFKLLDQWLIMHPAATNDDIKRYCEVERKNAINMAIVDMGSEYNEIQHHEERVFIRVRVLYTDESVELKSPWSNREVFEPVYELQPPTCWINDDIAYIGRDSSIQVYYVHNSESGSRATEGKVFFTTREDGMVDDMSEEWDKKDIDAENYTNLFVHTFDLTRFKEECTVRLQAHTVSQYSSGGIGPGSNIVSLRLYFPPEMSLRIDATPDVDGVYVIDRFPIKYTIAVSLGGDSNVVGYDVSVIADESAVIQTPEGYKKTVANGSVLYSTWISADGNYPYTAQLLPQDAVIPNGCRCKLHVSANISTGISAEAELPFIANIEDNSHNLFIKYLFDPENLSMAINAFAGTEVVGSTPEDTFEIADEDCIVSIYRRNDDGTMVPIAENIPNIVDQYVIDPHPSLKDASYRIVAIDTAKGNRVFMDAPGYPINCSDIVLQWDESYDAPLGEEDLSSSKRQVTGTMLRLKYNIDVNETANMDTNMIKYIGRKDPVSYYGTHTGYTASWSTTIPKYDMDTVRLLRKLQVYPGNVYVREPSGTGYWASVKVAFPINHCATTIDVSIDITRVEGGK